MKGKPEIGGTKNSVDGSDSVLIEFQTLEPQFTLTEVKLMIYIHIYLKELQYNPKKSWSTLFLDFSDCYYMSVSWY